MNTLLDTIKPFKIKIEGIEQEFLSGVLSKAEYDPLQDIIEEFKTESDQLDQRLSKGLAKEHYDAYRKFLVVIYDYKIETTKLDQSFEKGLMPEDQYNWNKKLLLALYQTNIKRIQFNKLPTYEEEQFKKPLTAKAY